MNHFSSNKTIVHVFLKYFFKNYFSYKNFFDPTSDSLRINLPGFTERTRPKLTHSAAVKIQKGLIIAPPQMCSEFVCIDTKYGNVAVLFAVFTAVMK
jgi:hypothetical protein